MTAIDSDAVVETIDQVIAERDRLQMELERAQNRLTIAQHNLEERRRAEREAIPEIRLNIRPATGTWDSTRTQRLSPAVNIAKTEIHLARYDAQHARGKAVHLLWIPYQDRIKWALWLLNLPEEEE